MRGACRELERDTDVEKTRHCRPDITSSCKRLFYFEITPNSVGRYIRSGELCTLNSRVVAEPGEMCAVFQRRSSRAAMARLMETGSRRGALKRLAAASGSASVDSIARENRDPSPTRTSALGIQMISKPLHRQIFGTEPRVSKEAVEKSKRHLKSHGIDVDGGHVSKKLRDVDLHLPRLLGTDINEHFVEIATQQIEPYLSLAKNLADANLPQMPKRWSCSPGWTKYEGNVATAVPCPDEEALVLDVEVCVRDSERPVLATAVSGTHWYSWVSERLVAHEDYDIGLQGQSTTARHLIPLEIKLDHHEPIGGTWRERLVVGHHVSYDRARTKEQYLMKVKIKLGAIIITSMYHFYWYDFGSDMHAF